ncbi:MAG: hypothetical protein ABJN69_06875 [Hellea sp.]
MEPIVPIVKKTKPASAETARGTLADLIASLLAAAAAFISFGYSALFFSRFLENDTHLWGVLSAFLLCFGVGAFAYVPAGLTSLIAWQAHKRGATKRGLYVTIIAVLPWLILSAVLVFISDLPKIYSVPIFVTILILTTWALITLRRQRPLER